MEVKVRRVGIADAGTVKLIRLRSLRTDPVSFASTHEREVAYPESEWQDWVTSDASGDEMATFLAVHRTDPVGMVAAYRDELERATFHVMAMWVAPEARGNGIGRRLLRTIEDWIASVGGDSIQLSVSDRAEAALHLYEASGYRPDGEAIDSPHTPGSSHLSLRKPLQPSA